jgi:outer membrane protein assembly factor BamB
VVEISRALARRFRSLLRGSVQAADPRGPPPLIVCLAGEAGLTVTCRQGDAGLRYHRPGACPHSAVALPAPVLAQLEGRSEEPVLLEQAAHFRVRASWREAGSPRSLEFDTTDPSALPEAAWPEATAEAGPGFLDALAEAARTTARGPGRPSLSRVLLRGRDATVVYHGHSGGVDAYDRMTGSPLWSQKKANSVLFGWQTQEDVYPGCGSGKVHRLSKRDKGKEVAVCACDGGVLSNASSDDVRFVFAGDTSSSVYCFDSSGKRLWKLGTGCGSALSMQFYRGRVYIVTTDGTLACLDASEGAVKAAQAGTVPAARELKAPRGAQVVETTTLETTSDVGQGVVEECVPEGSKVRVRVVSPGYNPGWNVQFPRNLREAGARYVVDSVRESAQGGYYRAHGEIRKLAGNAPAPSPAGGKRKKKS